MIVDPYKDEYVIVELIPTSLNPDKGLIIQLSALKLKGLSLVDRFDYRINEDMINIPQLLEIISYDKESFKYVDSKEAIINDFNKWCDKKPILYIDNLYTLNYLKDVDSEKESILKHLGEEYSDDIIDKLMKKYGLEPTNYIVDLLYESLIYESNKNE